MRNNAFIKARKLISENKKIVIISHLNPDGDAIGSSLALYIFFKKRFLDANIVVPNNFPEFLSWMPHSEKIVIYKNNQKKAEQLIEDAELIFCLDFNMMNRMGKLCESFNRSKALKILIDHHADPGTFCDLIHSDTKAPSTAELVYDFINYADGKSLIDKEIAECIYTGIITDTGSLSFSCNDIKTYKILSQLFTHGIDGAQIHSDIYDTFSENRLRLLGYCLSEKLTILKEFNTAYIALSKDELKKFNFKIGDTEGIVNYPLSLKGVRFAALLAEKDGHVKVSLRSKGEFNVSELSAKHFNGAGHKNAAGGELYTTINEAVKKFIETVKLNEKELKQL
jgi:phosphoesterase RecJ-like protein